MATWFGSQVKSLVDSGVCLPLLHPQQKQGSWAVLCPLLSMTPTQPEIWSEHLEICSPSSLKQRVWQLINSKAKPVAHLATERGAQVGLGQEHQQFSWPWSWFCHSACAWELINSLTHGWVCSSQPCLTRRPDWNNWEANWSQLSYSARARELIHSLPHHWA